MGSERDTGRGISLIWLRRWMSQVVDPGRALSGARNYPGYWADWRRYARLPGAEPLRLADSHPQLHDNVPISRVDTHYYYANGWAMRRIVATGPAHHVDVGSKILFVNLLAAVVPVTFVDLRPLAAPVSGLGRLGASIQRLPVADRSIRSLSSLHVIEHIGLGRYGDALDAGGTPKAAAELSRVLAVGGHLFLALPVGRPRLCFNAHRIHAAGQVRDFFPDLDLVEFSGEHDDGRFVERVKLSEFDTSEYACGFFWFTRFSSKGEAE